MKPVKKLESVKTQLFGKEFPKSKDILGGYIGTLKYTAGVSSQDYTDDTKIFK
jgi:hypothetical protein